MDTVEALWRIGLGDQEAWVFLAHNHGKKILHQAWKMTGDWSLAEDVAQETFLQLRAHAGCFHAPPEKGEAAAAAWILRLSYNISCKLLRSRARARKYAEAKMEQRVQNQSNQEQALRESLRSEVLLLPEKLRLPIVLRYYGNLEIEEVAFSLGIQQAAARKRLERG